MAESLVQVLLSGSHLINTLILLVVPVHALALMPLAAALSPVGLPINAIAVLFSILPVTLILASILPGVDAKAMLPIV